MRRKAGRTEALRVDIVWSFIVCKMFFFFLYLRWHPGDRFSLQNPSNLSWPIASAGHRSWAWCWSGWPEGSLLRRWCSNHWRCEGCSPRSKRKGVGKKCAPHCRQKPCSSRDSDMHPCEGSVCLKTTILPLQGESHPAGLLSLDLQWWLARPAESAQMQIQINEHTWTQLKHVLNQQLITLPDSIRGRLWGAPLSTSLTLQNTLLVLLIKISSKMHWNSNNCCPINMESFRDIIQKFSFKSDKFLWCPIRQSTVTHPTILIGNPASYPQSQIRKWVFFSVICLLLVWCDALSVADLMCCLNRIFSLAAHYVNIKRRLIGRLRCLYTVR